MINQRDYEIATTSIMTESGENQIAETLDDTAEQVEEQEATETENKSSRSWEWLILFLVAGMIILFDQYSKYLVESSLPLFTYYAPIPELENIFRITHVSNTGVAFGLFQDGNSIFTILAIIVSIAIIIYNARLESGHKLLRLALGLQMGGALGNMIDRTRQGYVTDFMDIGPWPVWNVADLAIVSGTILLVLIMFREEREEQRAAALKAADDDQAEPQTEVIGPQVDESPTS